MNASLFYRPSACVNGFIVQDLGLRLISHLFYLTMNQLNCTNLALTLIYD